MNKKKKLIAFTLILVITAALEFVLIAALWNKDEKATMVPAGATFLPAVAPSQYAGLLTANDVLSSRLDALLQADQQYNSLLTSSAGRTNLDSVTQQIYAAEEFLRASIDSVSLNLPQQADTAWNTLTGRILSSYRSILQSRQAIGTLRNFAGVDRKTFNPDQQDMLKTQAELRDKNGRIATLEATIKSLETKKEIQTPEQKESSSNEDLATLKAEMAAQQNRVSALTILNSSLKQDNEKLLRQQNDGTKAVAEAAETALRSKAATLQQRVEALNAELGLAMVDCNLSRVDAAQIISNSKQRKQLLTEASGILTGLANSEDVAIKKKVQDKILRLNRIAANSRD
jgi:hypothetical protein